MSLALQKLLVAVLVCLPALASATVPQYLPQDLAMRVWTKQEGLPDDSVTAVLQTREGYLWVGTSAGLARFDGVRFVSFAPPSEKTNTPIDITALCEDSTRRLWIGTQNDGLLYLLDGVMSHFRDENSSLNQTIHSIAEDASGNLWLGTPSGLCRLTGQKVTCFTAKDGLPNDFVSNVHVARSGTVWITTKGGMCQFKDGKIFPFPFQTDSPGRNPESLGVYEDRENNLWAFGDTYLVNLTAGKHLNHFASGETKTSARIWGLCEGRHGELWIGTSGKELYCFANDKFMPIAIGNSGLTSDVRSLCEDSEGNLWLGTYGGGLIRLQPRNVRVVDATMGLPNRPAVCLGFNSQGRVWLGFERDGIYTSIGENFEPIQGESGKDFQNLVSSLAAAPDSSLWIGTPGAGLYCVANQGVVHYTTANGLANNHITAVAVDHSGVVWAGTVAGDLHRLTKGEFTKYGAASGLPEQPVTAILAARSGGVWIGFGNGQIIRETGGKFLFTRSQADLNGKAVRALHEDAAGNLWAGTAGGRIACLANETWLHWNLNPGSPKDHPLLGILSSDDGDLWFGTSSSIYRLEQREIAALLASQTPLRPQLIYKADMVGSPPTYGWPQAAKSPDGKLWFGLANAVVTLDLRAPMASLTMPPVLIEQVAVNEDIIPHTATKATPTAVKNNVTSVRLPSDCRSLEIRFTALNLSAPEKIRFRHRLDGFDQDWVVDNDPERKVHYGRLPFGSYTFQVQAGSADESWFEPGAVIHFLVPTPIWRTPLALAFYVLGAIVLIATIARLFFNRRLRHKLAALAAQQAMERERVRIAKDMHDEIGSKLTKISFMSERAKGELVGQESVAKKLFSIAHTSRDLLQTLDEIVWAVNPRNDTLEHLANYLGQYATEYLHDTNVGCDLHIPNELPEHPFSAETRHNIFLAFEEALNNALKHGHATLVRVEMKFERVWFEIKIMDNGSGFDPGKTNPAEPLPGSRGGNGLRNMTQRLADCGGNCAISSTPGKGTTVTFNVPLTNSGAVGKQK